MASGGVYQELKDFISCEICYEYFEGRDPRLLPCGHSFCCQCIQGVIDLKKRKSPITDVIPCPICQTPAKIPDGKPTKLPAYFQSSKIQDIIKNLKDKHSECKSCKSQVSYYCFTCTYAMCTPCKSKHDRRNKTHPSINVTGSAIAYLICPDHDKHVDAFCVDCSRAVCNVCTIGDHCDHRICDFTCDTDKAEDTLIQMFKARTDAADRVLHRVTILQRDFNTDMDNVKDIQI